MKYIFRFTIALHYTENQQKLNHQDLVEALRSCKFPYIDRWEELVQYTKPCIDDLIKTFNKQNLADSQVEIINSHIEPFKIDFNVEDLLHIWENEKQKILAKIVRESVKTGDKFTAIGWQVSTNISNRHSIQTEPSAFISINTSGKKTQFESNKK